MHETYWTSAAQLLGMKRGEIVGVVQVEGGMVITTHDGQRTLATTDGVVGPWVGELPDVQGDDEPEPVPDGTAAEVLAWVDGDPDRARRAREAETAKPKPRTGLVAELEKLASQ